MFVQSGLNIYDVASFYTQNNTIVRKVYDTDPTASPTATFLDSILISFMLDTE
jgi:uridylate kinase